MPAALQIDVKQVKTIIDQLNLDEKNELSKYLNKITLQTRIQKIRNSNKKAKISESEIMSIVKEVKRKRAFAFPMQHRITLNRLKFVFFNGGDVCF